MRSIASIRRGFQRLRAHEALQAAGLRMQLAPVVEGEVDPGKGYLIDYGDIKNATDPLVKQLDHFYLNEIEGLSNPTSENIAEWIWDHLKNDLPQISAIIVYETCTSACEYRGK